VTDSADWDIASGVGLTALGAAACRAVETLHEPPLVRDPYAGTFVKAARSPASLPVTPQEADADQVFPWPAFAGYVGVRSRFFDEFLAAAAADGLRQVVILAAGLDTRAFRLDWPPGVTAYEVDARLVLSFKEQVLADAGARPRCARHVVVADLRGQWTAALPAAGFDPARPAAWLAEGLLPYLSDAEKDHLLAGVRELSAPGTRIAIEHLSAGMDSMRNYAAFTEAPRRDNADFDVTALWAHEEATDPVPWLAQRGWGVAVAPLSEVAAGYGRPLSGTLPESMLSTVAITARLPGPRGRDRGAAWDPAARKSTM
jgi:methyltransferase (TIGR00027 family)